MLVIKRNFSDQNQLISQFFTQMLIALVRKDYFENIKSQGKLKKVLKNKYILESISEFI